VIKLAVDAWNELTHELGLAPVQRLTTGRGLQLATRLAEAGGLDGWQLALDKVRSTPGLHKQAAGGWRITFDWLVAESNFIKITAGNYDGWNPNNRRNGVGHAGSSSCKRANYDAFFAGLAAAARAK
jgi:hypothetical protein